MRKLAGVLVLLAAIATYNSGRLLDNPSIGKAAVLPAMVLGFVGFLLLLNGSSKNTRDRGAGSVETLDD